MDNNKTIVTMCCLICNESVDIDSTELEEKIPLFSSKHKKTNCIIEGYIDGRSIGPFVQDNKINNKVLN